MLIVIVIVIYFVFLFFISINMVGIIKNVRRPIFSEEEEKKQNLSIKRQRRNVIFLAICLILVMFLAYFINWILSNGKV